MWLLFFIAPKEHDEAHATTTELLYMMQIVSNPNLIVHLEFGE